MELVEPLDGVGFGVVFVLLPLLLEIGGVCVDPFPLVPPLGG